MSLTALQQSQESGKKTKSSIEQNLSSPLLCARVSQPLSVSESHLKASKHHDQSIKEHDKSHNSLMTLDDSASPSCAEPVQTLRLFRPLDSRCFGCVSGSFGRGSESPSTHKRKRDAMWKCQRVPHANQRLRKAKQWSMSRDVNFLGRNLDFPKSCLIGNHWTEVLRCCWMLVASS